MFIIYKVYVNLFRLVDSISLHCDFFRKKKKLFYKNGFGSCIAFCVKNRGSRRKCEFLSQRSWHEGEKRPNMISIFSRILWKVINHLTANFCLFITRMSGTIERWFALCRHNNKRLEYIFINHFIIVQINPYVCRIASTILLWRYSTGNSV